MTDTLCHREESSDDAISRVGRYCDGMVQNIVAVRLLRSSGARNDNYT
jgi:hypothetical protein